MPIERCLVADIIPSWGTAGGDRFLFDPLHRMVLLQLASEPEKVYVVTDQKLPSTLSAAILAVESWRIADEIDRNEG